MPNQEDGGHLKAFFAHDPLTHAEHPLRKKGEDGIQMFMGHLNSCVYSSAHSLITYLHLRDSAVGRIAAIVLVQTSRLCEVLAACNAAHQDGDPFAVL
jgi:hypothetical protein